MLILIFFWYDPVNCNEDNALIIGEWLSPKIANSYSKANCQLLLFPA